MPDHEEMRSFLEEQVVRYNHPGYIESDPIQIPHLFTLKEDIEIAGFLAAVIAWGRRTSIIRNAKRIVEIMGESPFDFVMRHQERDLDRLDGFVHRTFNAFDLAYFITALRHLYTHKGGLEGIFLQHQTATSLQPAIHHLKKEFFSLPHLPRTRKHLPDPLKGSAAKRINMYLRWMVRRDDRGVDLGLWKDISPALLSCPLDVHSGNIARKLGLLTRKQNDAKAVAALDEVLRGFDPADPAKYDFALFGAGVSGAL